METNSEIISKDVIFHERLFPYQFMKNKSNMNELGTFFLLECSDLPFDTDHNTIFHDSNHLYDFTSIITENTNDKEEHQTSKDHPDNVTITNTEENNTPEVATEAQNSEAHNDSDVLTEAHHDPNPRQSHRIKTTPAYLKDYQCNPTKHWCGVVEHKNIRASFTHLNTSKTYHEPRSYIEAITNPLWKEAMDKELKALDINKTWELDHLPKGKKAIGCKWLFKIEHKADGSIERYKARLVAKGYNQKQGIDNDET